MRTFWNYNLSWKNEIEVLGHVTWIKLQISKSHKINHKPSDQHAMRNFIEPYIRKLHIKFQCCSFWKEAGIISCKSASKPLIHHWKADKMNSLNVYFFTFARSKISMPTGDTFFFDLTEPIQLQKESVKYSNKIVPPLSRPLFTTSRHYRNLLNFLKQFYKYMANTLSFIGLFELIAFLPLSLDNGNSTVQWIYYTENMVL